jgi:hypothetical protein
MKRIAIYIALYLLSIAGCMGIFEVYMRSAEIELPSMEIDRKLGEVYLPNHPMIKFHDGFYMGTVNKYGYLGVANHLKKADNEIRIGLLGDSYVAALELFERHHFKTIVENELNQDSLNVYKLANFGKTGFHLPGIYAHYMEFVSKFDMDYNLIFLNNANLHEAEYRFSPQFSMENGELVMRSDFAESDDFKLYDHIRSLTNSSLFLLLNRCKSLAQNGRTPYILFDKFYTPFEHPATTSDPEPQAIEAVALDEIRLKMLENLGKVKNLMVVLETDIAQETRKQLNDLDLTIVDLYPVIKSLQDQGINPYYWKVRGKEGHWNAQAHKAVGGYLAHRLKQIFATHNISTIQVSASPEK